MLLNLKNNSRTDVTPDSLVTPLIVIKLDINTSDDALFEVTITVMIFKCHLSARNSARSVTRDLPGERRG